MILISHRIYESGHEVPFYQPLLSLEIFTRAINGLDIATGKVKVGTSYLTKGTEKSEYREGNRTMQWEVLPGNATYNFTTGKPNMVEMGGTSGDIIASSREDVREMGVEGGRQRQSVLGGKKRRRGMGLKMKRSFGRIRKP